MLFLLVRELKTVCCSSLILTKLIQTLLHSDFYLRLKNETSYVFSLFSCENELKGI